MKRRNHRPQPVTTTPSPEQRSRGTHDADQAEPGPAGPSPLEVRYRRLLRVLPAVHRAVREQEMVDAFLASECAADPDNADLTLHLGWPGVREAVGVLALAVRVRWGASPRGSGPGSGRTPCTSRCWRH